MRPLYSLILPLTATLLLFLGYLGLSHQPAEDEVAEDSPHIPGAMQAMRFLAGQRAYPGRDIPSAGYTAAYERGASLNTAEATDKAGEEPWQTMGPHNIGGRTLTLAFNPEDPNTLFAGSASGGLWRSRTAGVGASAWHPMPTGLPLLGVSSIAIAPDDSNTMFIGTGEVYSHNNTEGGIVNRLTRGSFGIGILRSLDAGQSWHKCLDWSYDQQRGVQVVRFDPTNSNVIWAGTSIGTFKSTNGGNSWVHVDATLMVTDLVVHPQRPNTVIIAAGNLGSSGTRLYRTTDGGANWTKVLAMHELAAYYKGKAMLSLCESQPDIIYASVGNGGSSYNATWLVRSNDAGITWTVQSTADYARYQGWFAHDVAVNPDDPSLVITAGVDIWNSSNGGATLIKRSDWSAYYMGQTAPGGPEGNNYYSHADHHDILYHPTNRDIIYFANDGGIFRTLNGGLTFEGCNGGYQTTQFYAGVSVSQQNPQLILGGMQDNSTAIFSGTTAWTKAIGGDGSWTGIDAADDQVLYGSAQNLYMVRSDDGGANWTEIAPINNGQTSFIAPFVLAGPADPEVIYAGRSFIFKSVNRGQSWLTTNQGAQLDGNPSLALAVSQTNSDVVYATTAPTNFRAGVFRTLDGGDSWQNVTGTLPARYPVGLAIDPSDDATVYVTFSGFGTGHVFRSTDSGANWLDIGTGLPDVPTSAVTVDPLDPDNIYIGTDVGVFGTVTGGASWFALNLGLPDAVMAMDLNVSSVDRRLILSTYGNGFYSRPMMEPISSVDDRVAQAKTPVLEANYPNPFNPVTSISYRLADSGDVRLEVFDIAGRRLRTLHNGWLEAGRHTIQWDGKDAAGGDVASGLYMYRLTSGEWTEARKMQLVR